MRVAIWVALVLYCIGEIGRVSWRAGNPSETAVSRWAWATGCGFYLLHVVLAFGASHGWSHATAYEFTATQTEALTGWRWGGGLYVNHLFTAVWLVELIAWCRGPDLYRLRARWIDLSVRIFFAFMILNGAVVFVAGPQRLLGVALVAALLFGFWKFRR